MGRLRTLAACVRHAGLRRTFRASATRAKRGLLALPCLRPLVDRSLSVSEETIRRSLPEKPLPASDWAAQYVADSRVRHFLDNAAATAGIARRCFPDDVARTIARAEAICRNEFVIFGIPVTFNSRVDWFWLPGTKSRWPFIHADEYPKRFYESADRPGDIKYPWELNRHQHFMTLAKAYVCTNDERFIDALTSQLLDWIDANPFRMGIHWTSALELGIRIIAWCNAFWLVKDSPRFLDRAFVPFLRSLYQQARCLRYAMTTDWLVANNHLVGEAVGLFTFAVLFPQFPESGRWRGQAISILADALSRQIFPDGVNAEQSTGYHRFVMDFVWQAVRLAECNGVALPRIIFERLEAMLQYQSAVIPPNGIAPQLGDCDDGRGLFFSEGRSLLDFRGSQAMGAVQFDRPAFARAAQGANEEALWLLAAEGWKRFRDIIPCEMPRVSRWFPSGGHAVLRSGDGTDATFLLIRCGPFGLGMEGGAAHSHADLLSPVIYWRGKPLIVDSGTFTYLGDDAIRRSFRSASAHNTVAPDGMDQASAGSQWAWRAIPRAQSAAATFDADRSVFHGVIESPDGYTHKRSVSLELAPLRIVFEDMVHCAAGTPDRLIRSRFHLAPGLHAYVSETEDLAICEHDRIIATLAWKGFTGISVEPAWFSPHYGQRQQNWCITLSAPGPVLSACVTIDDSVPAPADMKAGGAA